MTRPKGSPNKAYKAIQTNSMSIKLSGELFEWVSKQPNKANYVRSLIVKDKEAKEAKEPDGVDLVKKNE
jgi:hypothetical protein